MPEQEKKEPTPCTNPREDVDDLIFHAEPSWLVSER